MKVVQPKSARFQISHDIGKQKIVIPTKVSGFHVFFYLFLIGISVYILKQNMNENFQHFCFMLICGLILITLSTLILSWMLLGKEVIVIDKETLTFRRRLLCLKVARKYECKKLETLNVNASAFSEQNSIRRLLGYGHGSIEIIYGGEREYQLHNANEKETEMIIAYVLDFYRMVGETGNSNAK